MTFDGTDDYLSAPDAGTVVQPFTVSAVSQKATGTNEMIFRNANTQFGFGVANQIFIYAGNFVGATAADGPYHSFQIVYNGASSSAVVDGTVTSLDFGTFNPIGVTNLIGTVDGSPPFLNGQIQEVGRWGIGFSAGQYANMTTNQQSYWGI